MAADLSIHIKTEHVKEEHLRSFFSHTLGSRWENLALQSGMNDYETNPIWDGNKCPGIWIGEVSWLKAELFDDDTKYVPDLVSSISDLIGEHLPILTEELLSKIESLFDNSANSTTYRVARKEDVIPELRKYMGLPLFTVSW